MERFRYFKSFSGLIAAFLICSNAFALTAEDLIVQDSNYVPSACTDSVTQSQTSYSGTLNTYSATDTQMQSFQVDADGAIKSVSFRVELVGGSSNIQVRLDDDLNMSSEYLEQATNPGSFPSGINEVTFTFSGSTILSTGTTYYVAFRNNDNDWSDRIRMHFNSSGGYANGTAYYNGDVWVASSNDSRDFYFKVTQCT